MKKINEPNNLVFDIVARIPLIFFGLEGCLDIEDINALFDDLVEEISEVTGIRFRIKRRYRNNPKKCRNVTYECKQSIKRTSKPGSHSNVAQFKCKGILNMLMKKGYGFVEIRFSHGENHRLLAIVPVPDGLVE